MRKRHRGRGGERVMRWSMGETKKETDGWMRTEGYYTVLAVTMTETMRRSSRDL